MKTEIIKRTFEAKKLPAGSPQRLELNLKSETSEYMPSYKYILRIHHEETATHNAFISDHNFRTKTDAEGFLANL